MADEAVGVRGGDLAHLRRGDTRIGLEVYVEFRQGIEGRRLSHLNLYDPVSGLIQKAALRQILSAYRCLIDRHVLRRQRSISVSKLQVDLNDMRKGQAGVVCKRDSERIGAHADRIDGQIDVNTSRGLGKSCGLESGTVLGQRHLIRWGKSSKHADNEYQTQGENRLKPYRGRQSPTQAHKNLCRVAKHLQPPSNPRIPYQLI